MRTIQLKVSDKVYDKFIWLLNKFSSDEVEIVEQQDSNFVANQKYLHAELKKMNEGKAEYISIDDLEKRLDKVIKKHED